MNDFGFFSAFLVGLAGGVHCIGMCGGIVGALKVASPKDGNPSVYALAYNSGRVASYTLAGAITGAASQVSTSYLPFSGPVLAVLSSVMLVALACFIGNWWHGLRYVEQAGKNIWRYLHPLSKRFLPFKSPLHALPYGFIWGWLPCGLVYSTLTWSLASGSAIDGALLMLFFGLGTFPALLAANAGAQWLTNGFRNPYFRQLIAVALFSYGVFMLVKVFT